MTNDEKTTTAPLLGEVLESLAGVVAAVDEDHRHAVTPCPDYDVDALRRHIVGWLVNFADGYADEHGQGTG